MIEHGDEGGGTQCVLRSSSADIAELFQSLDIKEAEWAFNLIDDKEKKADVLMELDEEDRKKLLENMDPEQIGHFIDLLDTDDAVDLIQELDEEDREEVILNIERTWSRRATSWISSSMTRIPPAVLWVQNS